MTSSSISLGLKENWQQFSLLVVVNAFVGAMIGLERTVIPLLADFDFGIVSKSAVLSFLISFGIVKAVSNLFAGRLGDRFGRKPILLVGWLVAIPVPILIIFAPSWGWIIFANVLLGINQGLCWSTTVIMKIDLVDPRQRGLAMGFNEFAGYLAVSLSALATGYIAATYGMRPAPFIPGFVFAGLGLILSLFLVRETKEYLKLEAQLTKNDISDAESTTAVEEENLSFGQVFRRTSWGDRALLSSSQAGLVNNLNDGMVWGLVPLLLVGAAVSDVAHPVWRGSAVGVYRLWRDLGFAVGAILAGLLADLFNIPVAILVIGGLTFVSGLVVAAVMYETLPARAARSESAPESLELPHV